ncbi:MAG TPA: FKBP-type peptidyl-prolyl cis-trans isomerase [Lentimicrobium sp.]|nr:FKBP-type peptidyl-prolyl cis-trans isomerase [Lentimicrobium sp.]
MLFVFLTGCNKDEDLKEHDDKIIRDYLKEENLSAQKSSSGLYYILTNPGFAPKPTINSTVTLHYQGYLTNHNIFDTTEGGNPATFKLTDVIEGLSEGLQLFGEGGKGTLLIPSYLAYGSAILPGIPANSVLIFEIHLINVE